MDATPGHPLSYEQRLAALDPASEITEVLGSSPSYILSPVGNGTTLADLYDGFLKINIPEFPSLIGVGIAGNVLFQASPGSGVSDDELEPLLAIKPLDGERLLHSIRKSNGRLICVSASSLKSAQEALFTNECIAVQRASSAVILALPILEEMGLLSQFQSVVLLITTNIGAIRENRAHL